MCSNKGPRAEGAAGIHSAARRPGGSAWAVREKLARDEAKRGTLLEPDLASPVGLGKESKFIF